MYNFVFVCIYILQNYTMAKVVWLITFFVKISYCFNGIVWNSKQNKFIPISDIPTFSGLLKETLRLSYEMENHNFKKKPIRLLFHEVSIILKCRKVFPYSRSIRNFLKINILYSTDRYFQ